MRTTALAPALACAALAMAGCTMSQPEPAPGPAPPSPPSPSAENERMVCDASGLQGLVGEKATAAIGERILAESGARTLRWGPPRTAWTRDYRRDRVNVRYDDDMVIEAITCG